MSEQLDMFEVEPRRKGRTIKAISLWEPWASAMALGLKVNETRSWPTSWRGDLLICAAQRRMGPEEQDVYERWVQPAAGEGYVMPYGCAVAVVRVAECGKTETLAPGAVEGALGNYEPGRFAWVTTDLRRLKAPLPVKGRQQFFEVDLMAAGAAVSAVGIGEFERRVEEAFRREAKPVLNWRMLEIVIDAGREGGAL